MLYVDLSLIRSVHGGIGRFAARLIGSLQGCEIRVIRSQAALLFGDNDIVVTDRYAFGGLGAAVRRLWRRFPVELDSSDFVFSPSHHFATPPRQTYITIHDLICYSFPWQHIAQYIYFRYLLKPLINDFAGVVTVSEASRQRIAREFSIPLSRIKVVYNCAPRPMENVPPPNVHSPYLLCVGARYWHKNVHELLLISRLWRSDFSLVVVGAGGAYRTILRLIVAAKGLSRAVRFVDNVTDQELQALYVGCSALVYPSKDEGFGIPPIEALSYGRPCVVSNIPVHREILGEAGTFVDLGSLESWRTALSKLRPDNLNDALAAAASNYKSLHARFSPEVVRLQFGDACAA